MELNITLAGERFYRSSNDAWIFGVAGGIANRLNVNPLLVRAAFVLLSFSIVVPVMYLVLGFSIPSDAVA